MIRCKKWYCNKLEGCKARIDAYLCAVDTLLQIFQEVFLKKTPRNPSGIRR